jgi:hypothetical protein
VREGEQNKKKQREFYLQEDIVLVDPTFSFVVLFGSAFASLLAWHLLSYLLVWRPRPARFQLLRPPIRSIMSTREHVLNVHLLHTYKHHHRILNPPSDTPHYHHHTTTTIRIRSIIIKRQKKRPTVHTNRIRRKNVGDNRVRTL